MGRKGRIKRLAEDLAPHLEGKDPVETLGALAILGAGVCDLIPVPRQQMCDAILAAPKFVLNASIENANEVSKIRSLQPNGADE